MRGNPVARPLPQPSPRSTGAREPRSFEAPCAAKGDAEISVDGRPFFLGGRIDRIDQNEHGDLKIYDYKTGDRGEIPERVHRRRRNGGKEWIDLQLPLYRYLALEMGHEGPMQLGYIVIPKSLDDVGHELADWTAEDLAAADETMREVVRAIRRASSGPPTSLHFTTTISPHSARIIAAADGCSRRWRHDCRNHDRQSPHDQIAPPAADDHSRLGRLRQNVSALEPLSRTAASRGFAGADSGGHVHSQSGGRNLRSHRPPVGQAAGSEPGRAELAAAIGCEDLTREKCREFLVSVTRALHRLRVGTLDSFFNKIAGACSMELGLPLGWRIVEEIVDQRLRDQAIAESLSR